MIGPRELRRRSRRAWCEIVGHRWGKGEPMAEHRNIDGRIVSTVLDFYRFTCRRCGARRTGAIMLDHGNCRCATDLFRKESS